MEFKAFPKIEHVGNLYMTITQKIHGSNAQIYIFDTESGRDLLVGSRNRWITPEDDNFGFATFVYKNKLEFITKLGLGQHFGEWAGPSINSGEGLTEKTFVLFDEHKFPPERPLPPQTVVVPVLYKGKLDLDAVNSAMMDLKANGSKLVSGFTRPEGIVINFGGTRYKKVFDAEETAWKKGDGTKERLKNMQDSVDVSHLLQPLRLEKLLSRDSRYVENYPESLSTICKDYVEDLISESQITGTPDEIKVTRKALGGELYKFVKQSLTPQ